MKTHPSTKKEVSKFVIANLAIRIMYGVISNKPVNQGYLKNQLSLTGGKIQTSRSKLATGEFLIKRKKNYVYM